MKTRYFFLPFAIALLLALPGYAQQTDPPPSFNAFNNYDFVPGDTVVFADDFANDQNGEFPAHWNLGNGQAVIKQTGNVKSFLLTDGNFAHVSPRIKSQAYLSNAFTIEFDSYTTGGYGPHVYFCEVVFAVSPEIF